jgi:hypothetical protein
VCDVCACVWLVTCGCVCVWRARVFVRRAACGVGVCVRMCVCTSACLSVCLPASVYDVCVLACVRATHRCGLRTIAGASN